AGSAQALKTAHAASSAGCQSILMLQVNWPKQAASCSRCGVLSKNQQKNGRTKGVPARREEQYESIVMHTALPGACRHRLIGNRARQPQPKTSKDRHSAQELQSQNQR